MGRRIPALKEFYYLDHFLEMVAFLRTHYPEIDSEREGEFLEKFEGLPRDAQAMAVRIANRKGRVFPRSSLRYDEISDPARALHHLEEQRLIRRPVPGDLKEVLGAMTKPQLLTLLDQSGAAVRSVRSLARPRLLEVAGEHCCHDLLTRTGHTERIVIQRHVQDLDFFNFLFFGRISEGMQAFTLRDLGIIKTQAERKNFKPRYAGLETARSAFIHARLGLEISEGDESKLLDMLATIDDWPEAGRDRTLARLGAQLEKRNLSDEALEVYQRSESHPARERTCRILFAKGERAGVRTLLQQILADPSSDEEFLFAEDFYRRKFAGRTVGKLTDLLRKAPVIKIDEAFKDGSERAAIQHFRSRGQETYFAENHFWLTLFGVLFWDELQEATPNEFDSRSTHLLDGSFAEDHAELIEAKLALIGTPEASALVREVFAGNFGKANGLFHWNRDAEALLIRFLEAAPPAAIAKALRRMVENPKLHRSGYPDLLQFGDHGVRFVEIKAEGDQIRRNQLVQIQALQACGFEVEIVRVEWCVDPMQEYVVVDLETTGGRAEYHRITEIGAVKIKGGEVMGTFETLLDPGRRIPPKITRLTGISDEMVRGQPVFADVADDLRAFIGGSIFVAHSVNFDYGFLRQEFARLGQSFRRPTLCTVVAMRKFFPGLPSYSLGNLCREFGIELHDHHRALCDATATAGLLKMINEKRLATAAGTTFEER